ncbi:hypothetical protein NUU61_001893 [Penicillium alfredii]|uniref:F-box domain-containing protein n=1 Tax=Penicillium alfredii TaxID=1506179 RepID=A0A9W9FQI7_9EURO|nr:uncharacterized protein NUU61_001893 [Penicillium alfredii]KAJ5104546.1 hypothetical protein NUU61_001893 [Penicillium alfredii]
MTLESFPPELLEAILLQVDLQTLLLAQRTSRYWARCIRESSALQQALFFHPVTPQPPSEPQLNPLLADRFPWWFPRKGQASSQAFGPSAVHGFLVGYKKDAYFRCNSSWRRMLVQQPPVESCGWVERTESVAGLVTLRRWTIPLTIIGDGDGDGGGLRMNGLYDLAVGASPLASGEEKKNRHFRVFWRGPDSHDAGLSVSRPWPPLPSPNLQPSGDTRYLRSLKKARAACEVVLDTWDTAVDRRLPDSPEHGDGSMRPFQFPFPDWDRDSLLARRVMHESASIDTAPMSCTAPWRTLPDEEDVDL